LDAPVLIIQGEHDVIRETNAVLAARFRPIPAHPYTVPGNLATECRDIARATIR
jgi:hypothetical protein